MGAAKNQQPIAICFVYGRCDGRRRSLVAAERDTVKVRTVAGTKWRMN
jgi:hypothetical protein